MGRRRLAAVMAVLLLAACAATREPPPALDLASLPSIRLAVQTIEVENRAQPPADQNFIAKRRSATLAAAAVDYLQARVTAAGGAEFGRATVEEASLVERAVAGGGLLSGGSGREMVGVLALRVAVLDGLGIESGFGRARVQITRPMPRGASIEDEDSFARQLTNDLVTAAGRDLDRGVEENLAAYRAP